MKKILVPTDFSTSADNAAKAAIEIAKGNNGEVHFLHILKTPVEWVKLPKEKESNYPETVKKIGHAKAALEKLEKMAKTDGVESKSFLVFDQSTDGILKHLEDYHHDFIVMGSHGQSGVRTFMIGSNAIKVVRNVTIPVLLIKDEFGSMPFKKIAFASEFNADAEPAFKVVRDLADVFGASLELVYVNVPAYFEESQQSKEKMQKFFEKCPSGMCNTHIWNGLNEERGIIEFAKDEGCDLIALATKGGSRFFGRLTASITEGVINDTEIPVLSIRDSG